VASILCITISRHHDNVKVKIHYTTQVRHNHVNTAIKATITVGFDQPQHQPWDESGNSFLFRPTVITSALIVVTCTLVRYLETASTVLIYGTKMHFFPNPMYN
jgi:hypothetical protein